MADGKGRVRGMLEFLFGKKEGVRPDRPVKAVRTDLRALAPDSALAVWFGHSSYLIQTDGRRVLVDPVFLSAAPLSSSTARSGARTSTVRRTCQTSTA